MPGLRLVNLYKRFGKTVAVREVSLEIEDGEIMTLLGPSGCGKTTTLRCIAGFVTPDEGEIYLGEKQITSVPAERRGIGFVFQNYALWPHMTVHDNLAFGLRLRQVSGPEVKRRIEEALAMVRLSGLEGRYPRQLSGGQQQRVALARALIIQPSVLLLDEPLSNLDAQLREEMRFEVRELQKKLGITAIYVTHDQAEALVLSDRIAIMHDGQIAQIGSPKDIYNSPGNRFVAGFIGLSSFIDGWIAGFDEPTGYAVVKTEDGLQVRARAEGFSPEQKVTLAIRPEYIQLASPGAPTDANLLEGSVAQSAYLGDVIDYRIKVGKWTLRVHTGTDTALQPGQKVWLALSPEQITLIPETTPADRPRPE
jgi:iron(III) transport system ATP-binding protein